VQVCSLQGARGQTRRSKRDEAQARTTTRFYAPCVGSAEAHISGDADAVGVALGGTGEGDSDPIPVRFVDDLDPIAPAPVGPRWFASLIWSAASSSTAIHAATLASAMARVTDHEVTGLV
jgi:hypothetical protein